MIGESEIPARLPQDLKGRATSAAACHHVTHITTGLRALPNMRPMSACLFSYVHHPLLRLPLLARLVTGMAWIGLVVGDEGLAGLVRDERVSRTR